MRIKSQVVELFIRLKITIKRFHLIRVKKYLIFLLPIMILFSTSCTQNTETVVYRDPVPVYRWMDRQIYLAYSSGTSPSKNNEFQKAQVQEAFNDIAKNSTLGENYFSFTEVDEAVLQPIVEVGKSANEYKSFVLIWPDADFNNFIVNSLGGSVPDQNAVVIINASFKRKFYMIIRSSCFVSSVTCNSITTQGLKALIARQMGFLVGMPPKTTAECNSDPENVMCALPNDEQWNDFNKLRWTNSFNNNLESILNNPNYYDENPVTQ